jgi:hypothetical protein
VPLRIAFDLDGVLADMEAELTRLAETLFGEAPAALPAPSSAPAAPPAEGQEPDAPGDEASVDDTPPFTAVPLTSRQQRRLWHHVESIENFWETLAETEPGLVRRLAQTALERRWEIIFLTRRPETVGRTAQVQSQRWLESKGFVLPCVYVVHRSRGRIAEALGLDLVVDDRPENCLDVAVDSKARAILVWRDDRRHLPAAARRLGIGVVGSVRECLDILTQDAPDAEQPGIVARVMRALGFKEPIGLS